MIAVLLLIFVFVLVYVTMAVVLNKSNHIKRLVRQTPTAHPLHRRRLARLLLIFWTLLYGLTIGGVLGLLYLLYRFGPQPQQQSLSEVFVPMLTVIAASGFMTTVIYFNLVVFNDKSFAQSDRFPIGPALHQYLVNLFLFVSVLTMGGMFMVLSPYQTTTSHWYIPAVLLSVSGILMLITALA
jgi:hypothetical protein